MGVGATMATLPIDPYHHLYQTVTVSTHSLRKNPPWFRAWLKIHTTMIFWRIKIRVEL